MKIYIVIKQTVGTDTLRIKFKNINTKKPFFFYGDGDVVFGEMNDNVFEYETKYINDVVSNDELTLYIHELESDDIITTLVISAETIDDTPTFSTLITDIDLGITDTTNDLVSNSFIVTGENLIGDIILNGNDDDSFLISADDGITWWKDRIPQSYIMWDTTTTFKMKIKRLYTDTFGVVNNDLIFSNTGNSFTISTKSEFVINNKNATNNWFLDDTNIIMRNDGNENISSGEYNLVLGSGCEAEYKSKNNIVSGYNNVVKGNVENGGIIGGYNNKIEDNTRASVIIGGVDNVVDSSIDNVIIIGGSGVTGIDSGTTYMGGNVIVENTIYVSGSTTPINVLQDLESVLNEGNTSIEQTIYMKDTTLDRITQIESYGIRISDISGTYTGTNIYPSYISTQIGGEMNFLYNNYFKYVDGVSYTQYIYYPTLTDNRTIYLPDADGTIALLDDTISPYWTGGTGTNSVIQINTTNPNTNSGDYSLVGGDNNINSGDSSIVVGSSNINSNDIYTTQYSAVFGSGNYNEHKNCIIAGYENKNKGLGCAIFGWQNTNIDDYPHYSIIAGKKNENIGIYSMVAGTNNKNSGDTSFIFGFLHENNGNNSVILGGSNITCNQDNFVYVPSLNINTNPTTSTDTTPTFLVRNETSGNIEKLTNTAWVDCYMMNDFVWYGSGNWAKPKIMKTADGTVHLQGLIKQPGTSSTVTDGDNMIRIPASYGPQTTTNNNKILSTMSSGSLVRVDLIYTFGYWYLKWKGGSQPSVDWVSIDFTWHV